MAPLTSDRRRGGAEYQRGSRIGTQERARANSSPVHPVSHSQPPHLMRAHRLSRSASRWRKVSGGSPCCVRYVSVHA